MMNLVIAAKTREISGSLSPYKLSPCYQIISQTKGKKSHIARPVQELAPGHS